VKVPRSKIFQGERERRRKFISPFHEKTANEKKGCHAYQGRKGETQFAYLLRSVDCTGCHGLVKGRKGRIPSAAEEKALRLKRNAGEIRRSSTKKDDPTGRASGGEKGGKRICHLSLEQKRGGNDHQRRIRRSGSSILSEGKEGG